jgi:HEAT repeat protein/beta-lactamase regulating signal transducer with metallopeptidase domain
MTVTTGGLVELGGPAAAWLLTYWLHSTLLLGSAWLLTRWVFTRETWRDAAWKAALVGGLVTATASYLIPPSWNARVTVPLPLAGVRPAPTSAASVETEAARSADPGAGLGERRPVSSGTGDGARGVEAPRRDAAPPRAADGQRGETPGPSGVSAARVADPATDAPATSGALLLLSAWALAALLLLAALLRRHLELHALLGDRRSLSDGDLPALLAGLRRSTGFWRPVRLTASASVATPLALGRGEICVPLRFLDGLGAEEQRAALAHELGHLVRRDPAWNLVAQVLEAVFFFQPLHRVARARLRQSAEFLADAWAVRETGSRLGLARCLAQVADWVSAVEAPEAVGSVAMAEGGSPLMARVRRLLESEPEVAAPSSGSRAVAVALVAVTAAFAPAVSSADISAAEGPLDPVASSEEPGSGPQGVEPQVVEVVRVSAGGTLAERMRSAGATAEGAGARAYWLVYVVEGNVRIGEDVVEDSGPLSWPERGPAIEGLLRIADEVGPAGSGDLLVLAQAAPRAGTPRIVRLAMRTAGLAIDLQGRPVYWLGRASPEESVAWSQGVFADDGQDTSVRVGALELVSRHTLPEAREMLAAVATSNAASIFREEAVEGLALHPTDATVDVLERLALSDAVPTVQEEAAETLGEVDNPRATEALGALVRGTGSGPMKEEALEALVERADTLLAGLLLDLALRDPDPELRIEAVERMAELPPEEGLPLLRRVLTESTDRSVRLEAVEAVAEIGTDEALGVLDLLIDEDDREVALEAAEAIGEFGADIAGPRLARIVREHPDAEVRSEALDQLSEVGGALLGEVLLDLALRAPDPELRVEAVEDMEELPTGEAVPLLGRVAFESSDPETQRQAAESLGEVGSSAALQLLDRLAREASNEGVARQAVESMGEFPESQAAPLLRRIATEHPSVRVRREALEQLGGGAEI